MINQSNNHQQLQYQKSVISEEFRELVNRNKSIKEENRYLIYEEFKEEIEELYLGMNQLEVMDQVTKNKYYYVKRFIDLYYR